MKIKITFIVITLLIFTFLFKEDLKEALGLKDDKEYTYIEAKKYNTPEEVNTIFNNLEYHYKNSSSWSDDEKENAINDIELYHAKDSYSTLEMALEELDNRYMEVISRYSYNKIIKNCNNSIINSFNTEVENLYEKYGDKRMKDLKRSIKKYKSIEQYKYKVENALDLEWNSSNISLINELDALEGKINNGTWEFQDCSRLKTLVKSNVKEMDDFYKYYNNQKVTEFSENYRNSDIKVLIPDYKLNEAKDYKFYYSKLKKTDLQRIKYNRSILIGTYFNKFIKQNNLERYMPKIEDYNNIRYYTFENTPAGFTLGTEIKSDKFGRRNRVIVSFERIK